MVTPPEVYTGAQFTLRYDECQKRIPDYFNGNAFGFKAAWAKAIDEGFINVGDVPHFASGIEHIVKRLELRDRFKELSAETPDAWIMLCMQRFTEVSDKYEDVLAMEAAEGFDVTNPSKESRIIEYGHIVNGQVQDTPYGELNDTSNYVSGRTRESHSGSDSIQERNELDGDILMDFRKKWNTTVNMIVEEFDVLFIRITGAGFVARGDCKMTEPSQYFKGRTVQEQMDEVIGYVDKRAEEVATAKADAVLQPAEQAKTAAQAAAEAAEAAKNATIAALPEIRQDISGLKAEDTALDGRLDTVELKVTTAEGNIVTIQGQIVALQNVQGDYVKKDGAAQTVTSQIMVPTATTGARDTQVANGSRIQNDLDAYAPMIRNTGNQTKSGELTLVDRLFVKNALNYKPVLCLSRPDETKPWRKLYTAQGGNMCSFSIMVQERNAIGIMTIRGYGNSNQAAVWNLAPAGITKANYLVTVTAGSVIEVWHKQNDAYDTLVACVLIEWNAANDNVLSNYVQPADFSVEYTEPVESDYTQYITPA